MNKLWMIVIAAVAVLALAGAAAGLVSAQTGGDSTPTPSATDEQPAADDDATATPDGDTDETPAGTDTRRDEFLDSLAAELGITREQLDEALTNTALDMVDQALADGTITEEEAAEIRERIESGDFPPFFGRGHHRHGGFAFGLCGGARLEDLAEFLGVEVSVIREGLDADQSLAQIAEANGKTRDELKAYLLGELEEKLSDAVSNDRITQERADEMLANASERIDELIDREGLPEHPGRFRFDDGTPEGETETTALTI